MDRWTAERDRVHDQMAAHPHEGWSRLAQRSDTYLVDPFERRRPVDGRLVTRSEAFAQAVAERAVELVVSALDVNALLDGIDLNAVLDQVDIERVLDRIDLNRLLERMDLRTLALPLSFLLLGWGSPASSWATDAGPCMTSSQGPWSSTRGTRGRRGCGSCPGADPGLSLLSRS